MTDRRADPTEPHPLPSRAGSPQPDTLLRRIVVWSAIALVLALALNAATVAIGGYLVNSANDEAAGAHRQAAEAVALAALNVRETACRTRIGTAAMDLRDERDTVQSQALVYRVAGRTVDVEATAARLDVLNEQLGEARALRARAPEVCSQNPNFVPPPR